MRETTTAAQDEVVQICQDLIRIDTSNFGDGSGPGEAEAAAYVVQSLREVGLEPQTFESDPGRVSVVVRIPGADRERGALCIHGHLDVVPADPALTDENTQRDERSLEWRLQDRIELAERWQLWAGLRHTQLERSAVRTDGSRATAYTQRFSTPWLALSWQATPTLMVYASGGQGVESEVAPNRTRYSNAGQALPALKSRQFEAGLKQRLEALQWQLAVFDIRRPVWSDVRTATGLPADSCSDALPCTRRDDGAARHRGLELEAEWRVGALSLRGSALWLDAAREGSADAARNGLAPTNVPESSLKLQAAWNVAAVPGLALLGFASHEAGRQVLPDNSVATSGWTRVDLGLRYAVERQGTRWVWRAGVDNVADTRAWKEAPFQFGHAYLYPLAPRTWRAALEVTL